MKLTGHIYQIALNMKLMQPSETENVINLLKFLWEKFMKSCQVNLFLAVFSLLKPQQPVSQATWRDRIQLCNRQILGVGEWEGEVWNNTITKQKTRFYYMSVVIYCSGISDLTLGHWDEGRSCVWGPFVPIGRGSSLERGWRLVLTSVVELEWAWIDRKYVNE